MSMLYYIIPPIVIVISSAALVYFLFRKAKEIPLQEIAAAENVGQQGMHRENALSGWAQQLWLKILERIVHRSKLFSLKLHNVSNEWFHSIREKRQRRMDQTKEMARQQSLEHSNETPHVREPVNPQQEINQSEYKSVRHMQSPPAIAKDQLEEALIRRIAINPRDIEAYERLGDYYMQQENYPDALECFRQVLRLSPVHSKAKMRIRRIEKMLN